MATRQRDWPHAMTALSTHDTKRGEDVRARITALAEVPDTWARRARPAARPGARSRTPGFGNLLWQAIVGAWPAAGLDADWRERLHGYAEKAMREAGDRTTWTAPDEDYEAAVHAAVDAAVDRPEVRAVVDEVLDAVADAGWSNALAAKLVAITMPGVPDVYQGSELWEQSLVDPDNRRPVDFDVRRSLLTEVEDGLRPGAGRRGGRPRRRQAARHARRPAGPPRAARPLRLLRPGRGDRRGRRPRAGLRPRRRRDRGDPPAPAASRPAVAGATPRSPCPPGSGSTRSPGDPSPVTPRSATCWPTCRWRCCCGAPRRSSGSTTASTCGRRAPARSLQIGSGSTTRRACRWPARPTTGGPLPARSPRARSTTATSSTTPTTPLPNPRSRRQPDGVHGLSRTFDPTAHAWTDTALDRPPARRLGDLRAARRHLHPRGHPRRRARQARPPARRSVSTSSS